ncbi:MAG: CbtA family protein [Humibacillus sp.]
MPLSFGSVLRHGVWAGMSAGLVSAAVGWLVVEPVIARALTIEDARTVVVHGGGDSAPLHLPSPGGAEEPLVSRAVQAVGGAVTSVLVGVAVGVIVAIVYARVRERLGTRGDLVGALALVAIAFAAVSLIPALVVPANPPAVGDPSTVGRRTLLYAVVVLCGVAVPLVVAAGDRGLRRRGVCASTRLAVDVLAATALVTAVLVLVPGPTDVVPDDVPADLLWDFRLASLAQLAAMWLTLGLVLGLLLDRAALRSRDDTPVAVGA